MLSGPRGAVLSRYGYRCLLLDKMQIEKPHGLVSAAPESGSQRKISASALQPCKLKIREIIRNLEVEEELHGFRGPPYILVWKNELSNPKNKHVYHVFAFRCIFKNILSTYPLTCEYVLVGGEASVQSRHHLSPHKVREKTATGKIGATTTDRRQMLTAG